MASTVLIEGTGDFIPSFSAAAAGVAEAFFGDPNSLRTIINPDVLAAEANAGEGDMLQLVLTNFTAYVPFQGQVSQAGNAASYLNSHASQVNDPATGEVMQPWQQYAPLIAWGDDSTATLTLRWRKGQDWLVILLVVLAIGVTALLLYLALGGSGYTLSKIVSSLTNPGGLGGTDLFGVPAWLWVLGVVVVWLSPDLLRDYRQLRRAERGG